MHAALRACCTAAEDTRGVAVDLATVGPLCLEVVSVEPAQAGQVSVLVEVTAERGGPANTPGLSTINGWPVRYASCTPVWHAIVHLRQSSCFAQ